MAITFNCDNCSEEVKEADVTTITVSKNGTVRAVNHLDKECFDMAIEGDTEAVQAALLG